MWVCLLPGVCQLITSKPHSEVKDTMRQLLTRSTVYAICCRHMTLHLIYVHMATAWTVYTGLCQVRLTTSIPNPNLCTIWFICVMYWITLHGSDHVYGTYKYKVDDGSWQGRYIKQYYDACPCGGHRVHKAQSCTAYHMPNVYLSIVCQHAQYIKQDMTAYHSSNILRYSSRYTRWAFQALSYSSNSSSRDVYFYNSVSSNIPQPEAYLLLLKQDIVVPE